VEFLLGTPEPSWLRRSSVPLFISHRRLQRYKGALPKAIGPWACDSGGFTALNKPAGQWDMTESEYIDAVSRYVEEVGMLQWAAPMDWMCEPKVVRNTGLTVTEHQHRTVDNYVSLRDEAPQLPFIPVLQGYEPSDYDRCIAMYDAAGVDLWKTPLVGLGTMCRRQATDEIDRIVSDLALSGLSLHGFGIKIRGLKKYGWALTSADSMSWSIRARKADGPILPGCHHGKNGDGNCANCFAFAHHWREHDVLPTLVNQQPRMIKSGAA
jgi:hypothetical protein